MGDCEIVKAKMAEMSHANGKLRLVKGVRVR